MYDIYITDNHNAVVTQVEQHGACITWTSWRRLMLHRKYQVMFQEL